MDAAGIDALGEVYRDQRTFRLLIEALARPGTLQSLSDPMPDVPPGVDPYIASVAVTLLDHEVRFATSGPTAAPLTAYIARRTGARPAPPEEAGFLFACGHDADSPLERLPVGSLEFPEHGATVVLTVERLFAQGGDGASTMAVEGPGIPTVARVHARGLAPAIIEAFIDMNREYPEGIDAFLVDPDGRLVGLPRTARIGWNRG